MTLGSELIGLSKPKKAAWVTLVTQSKFLPGVAVLYHSLQATGTKYPLVVAYTDSLSSESAKVIENLGCILRKVAPMYPNREDDGQDQHVPRFRDTWTKLAVFGLDEFETIGLIDCDVLVRKNMDQLFEMDLPLDCIAAAHACTCNPRKLVHYPKDWIPENCGHSYANGTSPIPRSRLGEKRTFNLLNSGLVMGHPSKQIHQHFQNVLDTDPLIPTFKFPDQDLLSHVFKDRWIPLGYQYNALKTLRYCHSNIWKDDNVCLVHYILDNKPWLDTDSNKPQPQDQSTHSWWWDTFHEFKNQNESKLLGWDLIIQHVPSMTKTTSTTAVMASNTIDLNSCKKDIKTEIPPVTL